MNPTLTAARWSVATVCEDDALAGLAVKWDNLFRRCATATPFQSHAWLASWWRNYGVPGRLRLVLVRHGDRLVAAAPFMLERRWSCAVLTPVGGGLSDFTDVLVDDAVAPHACRLLVTALLARRDWQVVDLPQTRAAAAGRTLRDAWPGPHWDLPASVCLELPAMPMADLVRQLPGHARKTVRRRLNQLDRLGVEVRAAGAGEADRAVADLLRLHALQWHGRAVNPEHLRPAFARHLAGAAGGMIDSGQAALLEYRVAGRLVASSLVVVCTDLAGGYLYGAHPDLREQADVTTLLLSSTLDLAHRLGCSTLSMLRGTEPYKLRWRPREAVNRRLLLARPGSRRALAYAAGVRARAGAIRLADERLPSLRAAHAAARRAAARPRTAAIRLRAAARQVAARLTAGPAR